MKIQIENTPHIVALIIDGKEVPARVWTGATASGIEVQCLVTGIATSKSDNLEQFERELQECTAPQSELMFPLRMIL
jgi:hypothetical protein